MKLAEGIKLIVGLGNIGNEYAETRHNVGFWYIDQIAQRHNTLFTEPVPQVFNNMGHLYLLFYANKELTTNQKPYHPNEQNGQHYPPFSGSDPRAAQSHQK